VDGLTLSGGNGRTAHGAGGWAHRFAGIVGPLHVKRVAIIGFVGRMGAEAGALLVVRFGLSGGPLANVLRWRRGARAAGKHNGASGILPSVGVVLLR